MSGQSVRRAVSVAVETIMRFAANATDSVSRLVSHSHRKTLILAACAALLTVAAGPTLFRADKPSAAGNSTLKCYDGAGNYEPCLARASASPMRLNGRTIGSQRTPTWLTTALYQEPSWATPAADQPANSTASAATAGHSTRPRRRPAFACQRHLVPCFFSALRRGVTHLASVAATAAQARPAREHL